MQSDGPWANWKRPNFACEASSSASAVPVAASRRLEAPVEKKFELHAQEIATLKQDFQQIKEDFAKHSTNVDGKFEQAKQEFTLVRAEAKQQATPLQTLFNESIAGAIKQQESSLMQQFEDLKTLIQSQVGPPAPKARKTTPREGENDDEF